MAKLTSLEIGQKAQIKGFHIEDAALIRRIMEMGLTLGSIVEVQHHAPFGGNIAVSCRGSLIGLRLSDAEHIEVDAL